MDQSEVGTFRPRPGSPQLDQRAQVPAHGLGEGGGNGEGRSGKGEGEEEGKPGGEGSSRHAQSSWTTRAPLSRLLSPHCLPLTQVESLQPFTRESFPRKERSLAARKQMVFYSTWRGQITADSSPSHTCLVSALT